MQCSFGPQIFSLHGYFKQKKFYSDVKWLKFKAPVSKSKLLC